MTLRIKGAQKMKLKNIPLIVLSNLTIAQCYHKAVEKSPHLVEALQTRFLEIVLTEPIDLDNIVFPTQENTEVQPAMEQSAIPQVKTTTSDQSSETESAQVMAPPPDQQSTSVGSAASPTPPVTTTSLAPTTASVEVLPTTTEEEVENMEYFSRKMRERRREKMAEEEEELPKIRKSKRLSQKNKLQF